MSQDPLKTRLARIKEKAISRYSNMGFYVYPGGHSPVDFMAFRVENGSVIEIRQVRVTAGRISDTDERLLRNIPMLSSICTREVCCWNESDFVTKTVYEKS
jgi:hypothetical protein